MWFVGGRRSAATAVKVRALLRCGPGRRFYRSVCAACAAGAVALIAPALCSAARLAPPEALDRYLERGSHAQPDCSDSDYAVQIDASVPALKKQGSMTGFKRIIQPGHAVYRGLRFTGDSLVKTQVIARFLARESNSPQQHGDARVTRLNYSFEFDKASDYNGHMVLKPRRKRAGLFRGELWLEAETAAPLRLWGDLVKSPSILVRSFRFVQDYETFHGCTEPLRSLLTARTRIAGTVEMSVWQHPASDNADASGAMNAIPH
jgi:hypothetical protein